MASSAVRFPATIHTKTGGYYVKRRADLEHLAHTKAKLSVGFIKAADNKVLFQALWNALEKLGEEPHETIYEGAD